MIQRCHNPNHEKWPTYGGRGIAVCERWRKSFADFLADMGERPVGTTIERIDVTGNYEPGNCRWATSREQHSNKRNSRKITIRGETLCLAEWEERSGTNRETISKRIARGINPESAVFSPAYRSA